MHCRIKINVKIWALFTRRKTKENRAIFNRVFKCLFLPSLPDGAEGSVF